MKLINTDSLIKVLKYAKPYKSKFIWVIFFAVLLSVFAALRPYLLKQTVDLYIKFKDLNGLVLYIALMAIVLLGEVSFQFLFTYFANWLGQDIVKDIREKLFIHIINFKVKYFNTEPLGKIVTRTVSDIENIASIFSQGLFMIFSDVLKMIVVLFFMFSMNWELSIIPILSMPLLVYATRIFQKKMKVAFQEVRTQVGNLNTFVQERLSGMKIVQLFNREDQEFKSFEKINMAHNKAWLKNILYNSIFFPVSEILSSLTLAAVVWYGGHQIINGDTSTTFGDLFSYTLFIQMLFNPLRQIADKFNVLQMGIISAERVFEVLDHTENIQPTGTQPLPHLKGDLDLQDVRFSYIEGEEILKGINLHVKSGETIAIVGSTGAGKSTIINLLNRFYDIDSGRILLDGEDIYHFKVDDLRKNIAVVLQDVFLFADTIFNNIALYNPDITKEQVIDAAKVIGAHDFIMQLPGDYDFNVKERGSMLSSGQRQLISFIRAYVAKPNILILDEATSSIDSYSEELIQKAIETITKDATSIIIAHRLATIQHADRIIVMDKGKIIEQGDHYDLLKIKDGYYKKLYESQFQNNLN